MVARVDVDGMKRQAALGWLPGSTGWVIVQRRNRVPTVTTISADEQTGWLDAGIQRVRLIGVTWRQEPDRLDAGRAHFWIVVGNLGQRVPGLAAVAASVDVNAPDHVAGGRVGGARVAGIEDRVVDLVTGKVWTLDAPLAPH